MSRFIKTRTKVIGLHAGSLVYFGEEGGMKSVKVNIISYDKDNLLESDTWDLEKCIAHAQNKKQITWIEFQGLSDKKAIETIGSRFGLHPLLLEDVLNMDHRPKIEEIDRVLFAIIKMVKCKMQNKGPHLTAAQVSLFLGDGFVLSFCDKKENIFNPVKERIRKSVWKIRSKKADYLFCALLDFLIDQYYLVLDMMENHFEETQNHVTADISSIKPIDILMMKSDFLYLRKTIFPLKEDLSGVIESRHPWIEKENLGYYKDVQDHITQIVEIVDYYNELNDSLMDFYQNTINTKMNEIMKVLTLFASLFIPLTFIVGIYGMNFKFIPELDWRYGYAIVWILILSTSFGMFLFFKKKKWL